MKKAKQSTPEPLLETPILIQNPPVSFGKKSFVIPTIKCLHPGKPSLDTAKLCIKHLIFFKVKFDSFITQPGAKKIIKRNLKYLKGTKYCQFKPSPSLYTWKLANQLEAKTSRERLTFAYTSTPASPPCCAARNSAKFLLKLARNRIVTKALQTGLTTLCDSPQKGPHTKQLQDISRLSLSNFEKYEYFAAFSGLSDESEESYPQKALKNIDFFINLQSLSLELRKHLGPENLYGIFETLGDLTSLTSLALKMTLNRVDTKGQNLKKTIAKFDKLKYLDFQLTFYGSFRDTGKMFVSLAHFKSLKYLNLEIFSRFGFDHPDSIKFVVAHKNLETLKFKVQHMRFDEYIELFEGIKKMKSLDSLCVLERERFPMSFGYGIVFKTLECLKKLKSFKLHLGYYAFDANEMSGALKHLLKHPSLEKLDMSMKMDRLSKQEYDFGDEFYGNLKKLRNKLRSFKLSLILFSELDKGVYDSILKIMLPTGIANKHFYCESHYF